MTSKKFCHVEGGMADHESVRSTRCAPALFQADLADPELHRSLSRMARRGVPQQEVDDIVQDALTEALSASAELREPRHLKGWLGGVVRHKVVDFHRRNARELACEPPEEPCQPDEREAPEMLRWAEKNLPGNRSDQQTFEWLLREGDGERLEEIAHNEQMPAERVRQRVARLRKHFRERWAAELAAALAAACFGVLAWLLLRPAPAPIAAPHDPVAQPRSVAPAVTPQQLRGEAFERCSAGDFRGCLDRLDRAAALDPEGDRSDEVRARRREAERSLSPSPTATTTTAPPPAPPSATQGASRFGKVNPGQITSDTAPSGRCVCSKGDPLCSCF